MRNVFASHCRVGRRLQSTALVLLAAVASLLLAGCPSTVANISMIANPNRIPSATGTTPVLAILTAPNGGAPAAGTAIAFTSGNTAAGNFPTTPANANIVKTATLASGPADRVTCTFTAGTVNVDTDVVVTASGGGASGTTTVTVLPPVIVAPAAGVTGPPAGPVVQIAPSVRPGTGGLVCTYVLTPTSVPAGGAAPTISVVSLTFTVPMKVTSPAGALSANGDLTWQVTVNATTPVTIVASGDASAGGTTAFDIVDSSGTPLTHYRATSVGPR